MPHDLQPDVLRTELIKLGDAFRAYQKRAESDLALLAELHERKARVLTTRVRPTGNSEEAQNGRRR